MMEQKMKEEEERKRTKEIEERMSLEETKEQVGKEKQHKLMSLMQPVLQAHVGCLVYFLMLYLPTI